MAAVQVCWSMRDDRFQNVVADEAEHSKMYVEQVRVEDAELAAFTKRVR